MLPKYHRFSQHEYVVKRKARKRHKCHECGRTINPRDEYYADTFTRFNPDWKLGFYHKRSYRKIHKVCEKCWKGVKLKA